MRRKSLIIVFLFPLFSFGQSVWNEKLTYSASEKKVPEILFEVSDLVDFDFSYDSKILSSSTRISVNIENDELKKLIEEVALKSELKYTLHERQVVFYKKNTQAQKSHQMITGIVKDLSDGSPLAGVKVSEPFLNMSQVSNEEGEFNLDLNVPSYTLYLTFQKDGYRERTMKFKAYDDNFLTAQLEKLDSADMDPALLAMTQDEDITKEDVSVPIIKANMVAKNDTVKKQELIEPIDDAFWTVTFIPKSYREKMSADSPLVYQPFQFGVYPGVSTDLGKEPYTITQGISMNVFTGLSAGIEGVQMSMLANINRFNVYGAQVSGLVNLSGGHTYGAQVAGLVNQSNMKIHGVQAAGIYNLAGLNMRGVQAAGITNITRGKVEGLQVAGINNLATESIYGMQLSGLVNTANSTVNGMQITGLVNTSRKKINGVQLAGFMNLAEHTDGAQLAGFFNYSHKLSGFQLGFINVVDSLKHGTSLGFFSFVKNGYRRHEISASDAGFVTYQFKSGTNSIYNIFSVGGLMPYPVTGNEEDTSTYWTFGYGLGTMLIRPESRIWSNVELMAYSINENGWSDQINMLNKLNLNFGIRLKNRFSIFFGPSLNNYIYHSSLTPAPIIPKDLLYTTTSGDINVDFWMGFNAGIQF